MDPVWRSTLIKVAAPAVGAVVLLAVTRWRGISWSDDLGLRRPEPKRLAAWLGLWLLWVGVGELLIRAFGLAQAQPWPPYPAIIIALRVLAIGVLGPVAEELVMRGALLGRLRRTALGPGGAIAVTAVAWAAMHVSYDLATLALVAADGVVLGLARQWGGSLWIPVAMHGLGNLISIAQSLS